MTVALKKENYEAFDEQKVEIRNLVMAGLEQVQEGKTRNFNSVCERLENKYRDADISRRDN